MEVEFFSVTAEKQRMSISESLKSQDTATPESINWEETVYVNWIIKIDFINPSWSRNKEDPWDVIQWCTESVSRQRLYLGSHSAMSPWNITAILWKIYRSSTTGRERYDNGKQEQEQTWDEMTLRSYPCVSDIAISSQQCLAEKHLKTTSATLLVVAHTWKIWIVVWSTNLTGEKVVVDEKRTLSLFWSTSISKLTSTDHELRIESTICKETDRSRRPR